MGPNREPTALVLVLKMNVHVSILFRDRGIQGTEQPPTTGHQVRQGTPVLLDGQSPCEDLELMVV